MWHDRGVSLSFRRKSTSAVKAELAGSVRVDTRTKNLTKRLQAGDIAVINHEDIDLIAAEDLVACKPRAILNAAKLTSGRYPNLGPSILHEAGIVLIDDLGTDIMDLLEGDTVRIEDDAVYRGDQLIAQGTRQDAQSIASAQKAARAGMPTQLKAFASNTMEYVEREQDLIFDDIDIPDISTELEGRHVLVVVRGYHFKEDLVALRPYIREYQPVIIAVDGGADAVLAAGYAPDMIVGDMDSVSDEALNCGAEIVIHAYRDGRAPGKKRVEDLGIQHIVFPCTGTSEDVAMLLADDKDAELIVAVGTHNTLVEFLDKGRSGMASTFLTRLVVGSKLIDAKGVSLLYRSRIPTWLLIILLVAGFAAIVAALWATAGGQTLFGIVQAWGSDIWYWITSLF